MKSGVREGRAKAERTAEQYLRAGPGAGRRGDGQRARDYGEALEGQITKNPFTAVLVALGLGYLVGLM